MRVRKLPGSRYSAGAASGSSAVSGSAAASGSSASSASGSATASASSASGSELELGLLGNGLVSLDLVRGHRLLDPGLLGRLGLSLRLGFGLCRLHRLRQLRPGSVPPLANACLLAHSTAQVVELRAVDVADRHDLDLLDLRRVERERPLDADAERLLADGERLACAGSLALEHDPLEHLHTAARALDDLEVDAHRVARLEARHVAQLSALEILDDVAHRKRA